MVQGMRASFRSFAGGLILALVLLYLILVAQFRSFTDPVLILLAVPTGLTGVLLALFITGTTLNVQSLMGVLMMVGMVVSNSILIVEFTHRLQEDGMPLLDAVVSSCRIRLRPILMTSLATIFGLIPMALKLGTGSEAYAPLARAIIGGRSDRLSVALTVIVVPAVYLLVGTGGRDAAGRSGDSRVGPLACARRRTVLAQPPRGGAPADAARRGTTRAAAASGDQGGAARRPGGARGRPRGAVGVLSERVRQRHRRRGLGKTAAASPPAASTTRSSTASRRRGIAVGQLLTDFGRTHALVQSSSLSAQAQVAGVDARRADVLLQVERTYFDALRAQAVLRVAQETVSTRQTVADQVQALAASGLKSSLDVSFAKVNLSEAQLLLAAGAGDVQASLAALATAIGSAEATAYALSDEPLPPGAARRQAPLIAQALRDRPDVAAERFTAQAAAKFADAERDLFPASVSAVGAFGVTPATRPASTTGTRQRRRQRQCATDQREPVRGAACRSRCPGAAPRKAASAISRTASRATCRWRG